MSKLRIAPGLSLDADYVGGGTFALLAKKGAGKTYTGRVMAEEFWNAKVPFVALDPMDAWWGLRSSADGEGEGIPVAIFGGEHGDAPLERTSGKLMADLAVDEGLSMVLSLKHLGSRSAERQFALDFLERLYRRNSELVHLLIDEADLFAPQRPQAGDQPLLGVTENIVRRGRNSGIGITLITQRPAVLNKDVLTQVDGLCVMRMLGPQDRNAIDDWVGEHGDTNLGKDVKGSLPDLPTGECWWWVPELGVLQKVKVRESRTFDSSPTRKRGSKDREPRSYADVDMSAIEQKMAETIERAKADDPKELRKQVAELRKQLQQRPAEVETKVETVTERVEVPVFNGLFDKLPLAVEALREIASTFEAGLREAQRISGADRAQGEQRAAADRASRSRAPRPTPAPLPARRPAQEPPPEGVTVPQQRVLDALAWLETTLGYEAASRIQVGFLASYKPTSGNFNNLLGQLKTAELVDYPQPGFVALTAAGRTLAADPGGPGTSEELQEAVLAKLTGPQAKVLAALIEAYPEAVSREELGERTDYSASSGNFNNLVGSLKSLAIISYPDRGWVQAEPVLFLEEAFA